MNKNDDPHLGILHYTAEKNDSPRLMRTRQTTVVLPESGSGLGERATRRERVHLPVRPKVVEGEALSSKRFCLVGRRVADGISGPIYEPACIEIMRELRQRGVVDGSARRRPNAGDVDGKSAGTRRIST